VFSAMTLEGLRSGGMRRRRKVTLASGA